MAVYAGPVSLFLGGGFRLPSALSLWVVSTVCPPGHPALPTLRGSNTSLLVRMIPSGKAKKKKRKKVSAGGTGIRETVCVSVCVCCKDEHRGSPV